MKVDTTYLDTNNDYNIIKNKYRYPQGRESPCYFPNEVFTRCPKYPGYLIGNFGTIIDSKGYQVQHFGNNLGYVYVYVKRVEDDGTIIKQNTFVHRMIMDAFDPIINSRRFDVNHDNGVRHRNIYAPGTQWDNLEWDTHAENMRHAVRTGLIHIKRDRTQVSSSMTDEEVHQVCQLLESGLSIPEVIVEMGYENTETRRLAISNIRAMRVRKEITTQYNMPQPYTHHYTEYEIRCLCSVLQELKHNSPSYALADVVAIMDQFYNIKISTSIVQEMKHPRVHNWEYISREYDI